MQPTGNDLGAGAWADEILVRCQESEGHALPVAAAHAQHPKHVVYIVVGSRSAGEGHSDQKCAVYIW